MSTTRFYFTQKAQKGEWGPGPWQGEPDKVQWTDEETGLPCLCVRGPMGVWCGYAGVEEGHPLFGVKYSDAPGELGEAAHAGLTFSDRCMEGGEEDAVCHIPDPGQSDAVWWFGFDCGHMGDCVPRMVMHRRPGGVLHHLRPLYPIPPALDDENPINYKSLAYAREVTTDLARAIASWTSSSS